MEMACTTEMDPFSPPPNVSLAPVSSSAPTVPLGGVAAVVLALPPPSPAVADAAQPAAPLPQDDAQLQVGPYEGSISHGRRIAEHTMNWKV